MHIATARHSCRCLRRVSANARRSVSILTNDLASKQNTSSPLPKDSIEHVTSSNPDTRRQQSTGPLDQDLFRRRDSISKTFSSLGSNIAKAYSPRTQLIDPPEIHDVGIASLIAAQAHLGHSTTLWNPAMQPFIYGIRHGIHIFNLDQTLAHIRRAASIVKGVAQADGNIIFVGTRSGQKRIVVEAAKRAGGYHIFNRWIPGTITNGKQVVGHGKVKQLITRHEDNKNPKADAQSLPNSIVPDLVIVLNPLENRVLLKECARGRVPTIGIIDTDVDPQCVTYTIPGNDDSLRFCSLLLGVFSRAAAEGRQKIATDGWIQEELIPSQS